MNLPNALTVLRFILSIGFVIVLTKGGQGSVVLATVLFTVAVLTDFFDGYFAKTKNLVSDFGKIMDPIADKFLLLSAFFIFMRMHLIAPWMFYAVLVREVLVTASRLVVMSRGIVIAAEQTGKYKTVLQMATVFMILAYLLFGNRGFMAYGSQMIFIAMVLTVGLTLFSGISYFWNNRAAFARFTQ